jgi:hypothetical protein
VAADAFNVLTFLVKLLETNAILGWSAPSSRPIEDPALQAVHDAKRLEVPGS